MKTVFLGAIVIVGLAASMSYAHNNGWNGSHMMGGSGVSNNSFGCGGYGMQPTNQEFMDQTVGLRKQMHELRFEYMEAYRNPETTRKELVEYEQKMTDLRSQMSSGNEKNATR